MKVTGFSFIKNAIIYDYPIVEAIRSVLPICDEFVVAVGKSDDHTLELITQIDEKKIRVVQTEWDENLREGGRLLAVETDKAFKSISDDTDWAIYIQGDEVIHEKYLNTIHDSMVQFKDNEDIDGLLLHYLHFYGSYNYVGASPNWYKHEIRVIKNDPTIYSYKDAQGFRKGDNEKLRVSPIDAFVYHYGWVKEPKAMQRKQENFNKYWHDDDWIDKNVRKASEFDYNENIRKLAAFAGTHPQIMKKRIQAKSWRFDHDLSYNNETLKDKVKDFLEKYFGINLQCTNYTIKK